MLTHLARLPIDPDRRLAQHRAYQAGAPGCGGAVLSNSRPTPALPDGMFVEDAAVQLDQVGGVDLSHPSVPARGVGRGRGRLVPFRRLARLPPDMFLEGGDVLRVRRDNTPAKS